MKQVQRLLLVLIAAMVVGVPCPAFAAGPVISVGKLGPRTCVSGPDLADALSRSGLAIGPSGAARGSERVTVDVTGTPAALVVALHDGGPPSEERLAPATCETATDVVAAFVTSALAPPPLVPVPVPAAESAPEPTPPVAPPSARTVEATLRGGLAERGVSLGQDEVSLAVSEDDSGGWHGTLQDRQAPRCSSVVLLGHFADLSPERRMAATNVLLRALETHRMCASEERRTRAAYLANALGHAHDHNHGTLLRVESALLIANGGLALAEGAQPAPYGYLGFSSARDALATTGSGLLVAGGVAGLIVPADYLQGVFESSALAGAGVLWAAALVPADRSIIGSFPERAHGEQAYSRVALAAASFSTAGLVALRTALGPPPIRRMEADYRASRTDEQRTGLSSARISEMESDLSRLDPPIPYLVQYSPLVVGGAVAMIPAFADGFASANRDFVAIVGLMYVAFGGIGITPWSPFRDYQKAIKGAGLHDVALGMGPGNGLSASLSGRF